MPWQQREAAPEGQGQFGEEVRLEVSPKGMGIHQEMAAEMIIPSIHFCKWKEKLTFWEMDILYYG